MSNGYLMIDIDGVELTAEDKEIIEHPMVGSLILFARNYEDKNQVRSLIDSIRKTKKGDILIAVDQEGGRVQRFKDHFVRIPPMRSIGEIFDGDITEGKRLSQDIGFILASELIDVGVDISFAPVLDIDYGQSSIIGDRAFHSDPIKVTEIVDSFISGLNEVGMAAVGKHFPGHGYVKEDSHLELPIDNRVSNEIYNKDLIPFMRLINKVAGMMPAHVIFSEVDSLPTGFSKKWLKEILREELGFKGVVFSDDLTMKATENYGGYSDRLSLAMEAGCDVSLICNCREGVIDVLDDFSRLGEFKDRVTVENMMCRNKIDINEIIKTDRWSKTIDTLNEIVQ